MYFQSYFKCAALEFMSNVNFLNLATVECCLRFISLFILTLEY